LHQRLCDIVAEAKNSLEILEDISPRRFQYVKSFIALRVIMTMKLMKIEQFSKEGWISVSDGESLIEAIQERLHHIEHFVPHAPNTGKKDSFARVSGGLRFSMSSRQSMNSISSGNRDSTLSLGSLEPSGSGNNGNFGPRNNRSQGGRGHFSIITPTGPPPNVVIKHPTGESVAAAPLPSIHAGVDSGADTSDHADETDNVSVVSEMPALKKPRSPEADSGFSLPGGIAEEGHRQIVSPKGAVAAAAAPGMAAGDGGLQDPQQPQQRSSREVSFSPSQEVVPARPAGSSQRVMTRSSSH